jgi:hypothetical protein
MNPSFLESLIQVARQQGAKVNWRDPPMDTSRHLGTMEKNEILLYRGAGVFESWFTLAHLFGHLVQRITPTQDFLRAVKLVSYAKNPRPLTQEEKNLLWDHEYEAAQRGIGLIRMGGALNGVGVPWAYQCAYTRMFVADYEYLLNFIQTGEVGPQVFEKFYAKTVLPKDPMPALYPIPDFSVTPPVYEDSILVV